MRKSAWKQLHDHPPALVRLLARRRVKGKTVRAMSIQEIAIAAGLSATRAKEISTETSWDNVTIHEAERFCAACNFDPLNAADRNRKNAYEKSCKTRSRSSKFAYLKKSPWWGCEFLPLIELLKSRRAS